GEVVARPLFAPDRRRHEAAVVMSPAGPVLLRGIIISDGERYALIDEGGANSRRVKEGERLAAGLVEQILPDRIVLRAIDGGLATVRLCDPSNATAPARPGARGQAPMPKPPGQTARGQESLAAAGALPQPVQAP